MRVRSIRTTFVRTCVVALILSCFAGPAAAATRDLFVATFGSGLTRLNGSTGSVVYANSEAISIDLDFGPDKKLYASTYNAKVDRVEPATGAVLGTFATGGGLSSSTGVVFGPDSNLYVGEIGEILRFNGQTGAFIDSFASGGGLLVPEDVEFGPDGNLYVTESGGNRVYRYNGTSGAFMNIFATDASLNGARQMTFGPDGQLYVTGALSNNVVRFNGTTGAFIDQFATGIPGANGLTFGDDGKLYVAAQDAGLIKRYDAITGAFVDNFATVNLPIGIRFAPVPEPATLGMLASGALLCGVLAARRRVGHARPR